MLCVSLEAELDPAPRLYYCFLIAPPLSLHTLPFLISSCLNLPFGTQGRSWRLESIPFKKETKRKRAKASMPRSPTGSCSVSLSCSFVEEVVTSSESSSMIMEDPKSQKVFTIHKKLLLSDDRILGTTKATWTGKVSECL